VTLIFTGAFSKRLTHSGTFRFAAKYPWALRGGLRCLRTALLPVQPFSLPRFTFAPTTQQCRISLAAIHGIVACVCGRRTADDGQGFTRTGKAKRRP